VVIARALALVPLTACLATPDPPTCSGTKLLSEVSTTNEEFSPWLSDNRLELYFTGPDGGPSILWTSRSAPGLPFAAPTTLRLKTGGDDLFDPTLSSDGRTLWYVVGSGASGGKIMQATRDDTGGFGDITSDVQVFPELGSVLHPTFTKDGLQVFYATRPGNNFDLYSASRASTGDTMFTSITSLTSLDTSGDDSGATISEDGETLYFNSPRFGDAADQSANIGHIGFATRAGGFADPKPFPTIQRFEGAEDLLGSVSPDGRTVVFSSSRTGGIGLHDIWIACQ
jgi:hypothetical protein